MILMIDESTVLVISDRHYPKLRNHGLFMDFDKNTIMPPELGEDFLGVIIANDNNTLSVHNDRCTGSNFDGQLDALIDLAIAGVNEHESTVGITFEIDIKELSETLDFGSHITHQVKSELGFFPTLGNSVFDINKELLHANLMLNSIPHIREMKITTRRNVYNEITENIKRLRVSGKNYMTNGRNGTMTDIEIEQHLNSELPYTEWQPLVMNALMMAIFGNISAVKFVTLSNKKI